MQVLFVACCVLLLLEKAWKQLAVVLFFRRRPQGAVWAPRCISVVQPILSGDPLLSDTLESNLTVPCRYAREYLWLLDEDDHAGREICGALQVRHPEKNIRTIFVPPPPDRCSPKMMKLVAGMEQAAGDVVCVLDDDTMLPPGGLESCLPHLEAEHVGLVFGLPYYVSFGNLWSRLVACFVNSHSLGTYIPCACLAEPFTINGMFYMLRREVYEAVGGFAGLEPILADDYAVAQRIRSRGYRLSQSPMRHPIRTTVPGLRDYMKLLHRWFVFPRETLMKAMGWRDLAVAYGTTVPSALGPLVFLAAAFFLPGALAAGLLAAYVAFHYAMFAHWNVAYLRRATPWRHSWLVPVVQFLLPFQLLWAILAPQRIAWRGHLMQVEKGGTFRFVRRRNE